MSQDGVKASSAAVVRGRPISAVQSLPKEIRNLLAGGIAGMIAKSFVAPIDRIKIMYQITSAHFRIRDVPHVALSIVKSEGFPALWKGNTATMIRVFPYSGIQFMMFDRIKSHFLKKHDRQRDHGGHWLLDEEKKTHEEQKKLAKWGLSPFESLISGSTAGAVSVIATYPLDLTRAQLAVLKRKKDASGKKISRGFVSVLTGNYKNGGASGLYRGLTPTLLGILPYSGIAFTINEQAKRQIVHATGREPTTVQRMQCGALAGLIAQSMTYPLEVTRRRMQTIGIVPTSGSDAAVNVLGATVRTSKAHRAAQLIDHHNPPNMISTISGVLQEQGLRGLFKGVSMNWFKGPFAFSISFTAFDVIQGFMATESETSEKNNRLLQRPTVA